MSQFLTLDFVWLVVMGIMILLAIHALQCAWRLWRYGTPRAWEARTEREIAQILRDANDALTNRPRRRNRK